MAFVELDGRTIHYRDQGKGRTALFVHPYLLNSDYWLDQIDRFAGERRCIAPDMLGHGRSDRLGSRAVDPDADARRLIALLDQAGVADGIDVVAATAGGIVAAIAYTLAPHRFRSLTLVSTLFGKSENKEIEAGAAERVRTAVVEGRDVLFRRFNDYLFAPTTTLAIKARYKTMLDSCPDETLVSVMTGGAIRGRPELPPQLRLPVCVPHGADDYAMTDDKRATHLGGMLDARPVALPQGSRLMVLEQADAFNAALADFWSSLPDERTPS